jgi:hypothetical protein
MNDVYLRNFSRTESISIGSLRTESLICRRCCDRRQSITSTRALALPLRSGQRVWCATLAIGKSMTRRLGAGRTLIICQLLQTLRWRGGPSCEN